MLARSPSVAGVAGRAGARGRPLGGNPFAGATAVFQSPYLFGIAAFVVLLASANTFLYFEQARLVAEYFPDRTRQTQVFGIIDTVVQALALLTQFFLTGRVAQKLGVGVLLVAVPVTVAAGFLALALAPVFGVFVVVMVVRRAGEYALCDPAARCATPSYRPSKVQGQELHRYRGLSRRRCDQRLGKARAGSGRRPSGAGHAGRRRHRLVWAFTGGLLGRWQREKEAEHPAS